MQRKAAKTATGRAGPIQGVPNNKITQNGTGNSPKITKAPTKLSPQVIDEKLGKKNVLKQGVGV